MKKLTILLILPLFLMGCSLFDSTYYTNPNSLGYNQSAFGGLCENCNRIFNFSRQQYDNIENIQCGYCGHIQNLKMAANRYTYLVQQQETQSNQETLASIGRTYENYLHQSYENQKAYSQQLQQNINRPGSWSNPIHIKVKDDN